MSFKTNICQRRQQLQQKPRHALAVPLESFEMKWSTDQNILKKKKIQLVISVNIYIASQSVSLAGLTLQLTSKKMCRVNLGECLFLSKDEVTSSVRVFCFCFFFFVLNQFYGELDPDITLDHLVTGKLCTSQLVSFAMYVYSFILYFRCLLV